ncbi:MAG: hypothetical protein ABI120_08660 [Gemmatimonadaceae bacterium]
MSKKSLFTMSIAFVIGLTLLQLGQKSTVEILSTLCLGVVAFAVVDFSRKYVRAKDQVKAR